jgi:hypothetical protein
MTDMVKKETPDIIKRWNWGAFVFGWIWGIFNSVWIALLTLIPFVNIVMIFVLGAKGNQWAWEKSESTDVDAFLRFQRKWNIAAAVWAGFIVLIFVVIMAILGPMVYDMNYGKSKEQIMASLNNIPEVVEVLGAPVEKDSFMNFSTISKTLRNGSSASLLILNFEAKGSKTKGHVTMAMLNYKNQNNIVVLEITPNGGPLDVLVDPTYDPEMFAVFNELIEKSKDGGDF